MTLHLPPGTTPHAPTGTSVNRDYATFASHSSAKGSLIIVSSTAGCATLASSLATAETAPALADRVWVNTSSKVYHCLGSADYGTTKNGAYVSEADARAQGKIIAGGQPHERDGTICRDLRC